MARSDEDVRTAFGDESEANRRYAACAERAAEEGHRGAARFFQALAEAKAVHARVHLEALGEIRSTRENLEAVLRELADNLAGAYPAFLEEAERERHDSGRITFRWVLEAAKGHEALCRRVLEGLAQDDPAAAFVVCRICGYTAEAPAPDFCPVCGAPEHRFAILG